MNRWKHTRLHPGMFSFRWLTVTSSCISATTKCASSSGRTNVDVETLADMCTVLPGFEMPRKQLRIISFPILKKTPPTGEGPGFLPRLRQKHRPVSVKPMTQCNALFSHLGKSLLKFGVDISLSLNS